MLNSTWGMMMLLGILYGLLCGQGARMGEALLSGAADAIQLVIGLAGGFALWSGLMEILRQAGLMEALGKLAKPVLKKLFPGVQNPQTLSAITMNLSANMLGLGNAATPMGLEAMRLMGEENKHSVRASRAMCMFLVINSSSVQLFPSTVITLRAAAGSSAPGAIVLPTLAATAISTIVGIIACVLLSKWEGKRA